MSHPIYNLFREQKRAVIIMISAAIIFTLLLGIITVQKIISSPDIPLLFPEHGVEWIRFNGHIELQAQLSQKLVNIFRVNFKVNKLPKNAVLNFKAMKCVSIWLDNKLIYSQNPDSCFTRWKKTYQIKLPSTLGKGSHEFRIKVLNYNGYPALLAYCNELKLFTNKDWECSPDGKTWTRALPVSEIQHSLLSRRFQRADRALYSKLHIFVPLFFVVFFCSFFCHQENQPGWLKSVIPAAKTLRWIVLVLFAIMATNNIGKIPLYVGMDSVEHLKYILYIADNRQIPLPAEGWQMFEAPLYYITSVSLYKFLLEFLSPETTARMLRIIPLLCGAAQIEICYRALRRVYPEREDLQSIGIIIGGLLPVNLYMSQVIGTEPMAGFFSGIAIVFTLYLCCSSSLPSKDTFLMIGFFLGLSVLTKITAILLIPPVLCVIAYTSFAKYRPQERRLLKTIKHTALVLGVAFIISGWYYITNWILTGHFFSGGWDPSRNIIWWQHPGYRTLGQFLTFGESLFYPIYSSLVGFWDSLYSTLWMDGLLSGVRKYQYRPPWNYGFFLSSAWLSIIPTMAILTGIYSALRNQRNTCQQALFFAACCIIIYVLAILYLYLTIPIYSIGKASYTLGLAPCYAVLSAGGFEMLTRRPLARATINGIIACWAVSVYSAYFVF